MITRRGRFLINYREEDLISLQDIDFNKLEEKYQKIKKFFNLKEDIPLIRICFIYDIDEYLFFALKEFKFKWSWARTINNGTFICIFAPSVCEKYTSHKKEEIFGTLVHEISHVVYAKKEFRNTVFNEGIALYYKNKNFKYNNLPDKIDLLLPTKDDLLNYRIGYLLTKNIIEKEESGKEKIIEFLELSKGFMESRQFDMLFNKIFDKTPTGIMKGGFEYNG